LGSFNYFCLHFEVLSTLRPRLSYGVILVSTQNTLSAYMSLIVFTKLLISKRELFSMYSPVFTFPYSSYTEFRSVPLSPRFSWSWMSIHCLAVWSMPPLRHMAECTLVNCVPKLLSVDTSIRDTCYTYILYCTKSRRSMIQYIR